MSDLEKNLIDVVGASPWTHPGSGQVRYYLNERELLFVLRHAGLTISFYGTGNVSGATWDGERYANGRATTILGQRIYLTVDGDEFTVHATGDARYGVEKGVERMLAKEAATAPAN